MSYPVYELFLLSIHPILMSILGYLVSAVLPGQYLSLAALCVSSLLLFLLS